MSRARSIATDARNCQGPCRSRSGRSIRRHYIEEGHPRVIGMASRQPIPHPRRRRDGLSRSPPAPSPPQTADNVGCLAWDMEEREALRPPRRWSACFVASEEKGWSRLRYRAPDSEFLNTWIGGATWVKLFKRGTRTQAVYWGICKT